MLHKGRYYMRITESLIDKKQNYINYWIAESSYRDLESSLVVIRRKNRILQV